MTILIVAFYIFANAPKILRKSGTEHKYFDRQAKVDLYVPDALLKLSPLLDMQVQFRAITVHLMYILNPCRP